MLTLSMLRFGQIVKGLPESEMLTHVAENKEAKLEFLEVSVHLNSVQNYRVYFILCSSGIKQEKSSEQKFN